MQRIFIDNHDRILYYSNPAGYIAGKEAVVDTMFQTQELERFLEKQEIPIRWEDGVYDRLLLGQRGGRFDPEAPPLKSCRVWQLTRDSPINMRFIPYEALLERFGQPDRKHYEAVYHCWLFGHYHDNRAIDEKHILLWEQIVQIL